jgi:hypothetical protein
MNWYMSSGNPGTVVMLNEFTRPASSTYNLYYQESLTGATADGTKETGDNRSYGDAGILFLAPEGGKITGAISLPYTTYFLPGQKMPETGATLAHQTQNPVYKNVALDTYLAPAEVAITIADTSSPAMYPVAIPVNIGNTTGLNIKSCRLIIQFDSKILTAKNVSITNTLAENWDAPNYTISSDTITIEMIGGEALQDSGVLVYLNFDVIGTANQQSPLHFIQAKFNSWNPLAVTDDGVFTTLPIPQVMVSLPDTSGDANTKISIPVWVDDVTSLNITSYQMELSYSRVILNATSATLQGTLASDWSIVNIVDNPGYLTLEIAGTVPLGGTGALVWINFDVIGSPGQSTSILFKKMQFNGGAPIANFRNGRFAVNATTVERITVIIPDTTAQSGASLNAPVLISESINAEIYNYKMTLEFDSTVLTFKNINMTGTLTSPWTPPDVLQSPGKIQINAEGDLPLSGLGTLIFIVFDVIGSDGSNTTIHFSEMIVNSGELNTITDDGIINVQGVVPVELASFTAISDGRNVTLRWHTITETNNFGFYLQRKSNLSPDWQTIKFLPGAGTTSIPQSYSIIDWQLDSGTWYYRLKQQDLDGQVHYSQIIEVNLLPTQFSLFQNYPNPFNSSTIIRYDLAAGEHDVKIIIFDLLGQQIKILFNEQQQGGSYQMSWDGSDDDGRSVATGIYFCHLLVGQTTYVKKMVLIE